MRVALLALLGLAFVNPSIPGAGPRLRIYLIDASASVRATAGTEAFTPEDALRLATHDLASLRPDDRVALVAFGAKPAVLVPLTRASEAKFPTRIEGVDGSSTDLPAALDTARALAEGGEIVLCSDGRSTAGRAPVERIRVPVHAFPLGPVGGVDASIAAIDAPASGSSNLAVRLRMSVAATGAWHGALNAGGESRPIDFTGPGRQDIVIECSFPGPGRDLQVPLKLTGAAPDLCPENDEAAVTVWHEDSAPRVLVIGSQGLGKLLEPEWRVTTSSTLDGAAEADIVILHGVRADAAGDLHRLARLVRDEGAGLVMVGGSAAFALGGWAGTPVEDLLPFWAFPNERSAVVVALDRSGSMNEPAPGRSRPRIEEAASAVRRALQATHDDDEIAIVTFAATADLRCPLIPGRDRGRAAAALQDISAGGSTVLSEALTLAGATARGSKAGRRHILLVTDGQSKDEEGAIRAAATVLREDGIGVTIVRIGDATTSALAILREAGAGEIDGSNFGQLDSTIGEALARSRELTFVPAKPPSLAGFGEIPAPAQLNKVTLKPGAEVLGRSEGAPVVAVRPAGRGRAAASALSFEEGWAGALAAWPRAGEYVRWLASAVAPRGPRLPADVSLRFEDERLEITAAVRGADRPDRFEVTVDGAPVDLPRRGENTYSTALRNNSMSAAVRIGGRLAAVARRPHPPEFDRVGPDLDALEALTKATGGSRLEAPRDLAALPGRGPSKPRGARAPLLIAALVLFLFDVGLGILPRRR